MTEPAQDYITRTLGSPDLVDNMAKLGLGTALAAVVYARRHEVHRNVFKLERWLKDRLPGDSPSNPDLSTILAFIVAGIIPPIAHLGIEVQRVYTSSNEVDAAEAAYLEEISDLRERQDKWEADMAYQTEAIAIARAAFAEVWQMYYDEQAIAIATKTANMNEIYAAIAAIMDGPYTDEQKDAMTKPLWERVEAMKLEVPSTPRMEELAAKLGRMRLDIEGRSSDIRELEWKRPKVPKPPAWWLASPTDTLFYVSVAFMVGTHPEILPAAIAAIGSVLSGIGEIIPL